MFLTDTQVGNRYSVSRYTIWRWVRIGKFPKPKKLSSGSTRWHISDIEAFDQKILCSEKAEN